MSILTQLPAVAMPLPADIRGFTLAPSAASPRLIQLTISREVVEAFVAAVAEWPVQALEYKSMLRFRVAKILDDLCDNTLQPVLVNTLVDRAPGGFQVVMVGPDSVEPAEEMLKLCTA